MSHSLAVSERFNQRAALRKAVACIYVAVMVVYLGWRLTIFSPLSFGLSLAYYLAEVLGFVLGLVIIFCSWDYRHRVPPRAPSGASVDVFVPCYRESIDVIRWTLIAAKEISYPHRTVLLDDGDRAEARALAAELGVDYLARGENVNAKAGNLNFGLAHSNADFVMVFDADHVALPHALDVMLGFFTDERVALVQTPQDYYNIDAFQYFNARRGGLWHDQTFFYNIAEPCRDAFNAASCSGTGVVYRRSALDAIGGIPVDTVTEDMHTSLKLHKAGFQIVYLNEPVAHGIAAADIGEYYKTRHRWAHGNLHALRVEKIFTCSGLTLRQRLAYLTLGLIYLEGWQQLLLFIIPVVSLLAGWAPFEITVANVLIVLFFPIATTMLLQELGCGMSRAWVNEIFSAARFPLHIVSWLAVFRDRKIAFRTSSKITRGRLDWRLLLPQLGVLAVSVGALVFGAVHLILDFRIGPLGAALVDLSTGQFDRIDWNAPLGQGYTLELVIVSGFWALFNSAKVGFLIRKAISDQKWQTRDYLFAVRQPLEILMDGATYKARADRISRTHLEGNVYGEAAFAIGQRLQGTLHLPAGALRVAMTVQSFDRATGAFIAAFAWSDDAARDRLARALLSVDWHREFLHRGAHFTTPLEAIGRVLTWRRPFPKARPVWMPVLYRAAATEAPAFAVGAIAEDGSVDLIAFRNFDHGAAIDADFFGSGRVFSQRLRLAERRPLMSLGGRGLDGATPARYRAVPRRAQNEADRSGQITQVPAVAAE